MTVTMYRNESSGLFSESPFAFATHECTRRTVRRARRVTHGSRSSNETSRSMEHWTRSNERGCWPSPTAVQSIVRCHRKSISGLGWNRTSCRTPEPGRPLASADAHSEDSRRRVNVKDRHRDKRPGTRRGRRDDRSPQRTSSASSFGRSHGLASYSRPSTAIGTSRNDRAIQRS